MATVLAFDNAVVGGDTFTTAQFVAGSGSITETGNDFAQTTADGRIHNVRQSINSRASFQLYGDYAYEVNTAVGLGETVTLKRSSTTVKTGTAIATGRYDKSNDTTQVDVEFDPTTS